jgi:hypothetical protein
MPPPTPTIEPTIPANRETKKAIIKSFNTTSLVLVVLNSIIEAHQNSFEDLFAQYRIAIVLIPDPITPAISASKKYFENRLGIKVLKK